MISQIPSNGNDIELSLNSFELLDYMKYIFVVSANMFGDARDVTGYFIDDEGPPQNNIIRLGWFDKDSRPGFVAGRLFIFFNTKEDVLFYNIYMGTASYDKVTILPFISINGTNTTNVSHIIELPRKGIGTKSQQRDKRETPISCCYHKA